MAITTPYQQPLSTFYLFPCLPTELQLQVWGYAAEAWRGEFVERCQTWTVPYVVSCEDGDENGDEKERDSGGKERKEKGKKVVLCHIKGTPHYRRQHPNLLWTSRWAREVMLKELLWCRGKEQLGQRRRYGDGMEIQLFMRRCAVDPGRVLRTGSLGCRVQDFTSPTILSHHVKEEEERLKTMERELETVKRKVMVRTELAGEGYVRLPLFNGTVACVEVVEEGKRRWVSLYPALPTDESLEV